MKQYTEKTTPMGWGYIELIEGEIVYQIPKDLANSDYQTYLTWLENPEAKQSTPNLP
jgi:hypothetical protein